MHQSGTWQHVLYEYFLDKAILWMFGSFLCYQLHPHANSIYYILISLTITCLHWIMVHSMGKGFLYVIYIGLILYDRTFLCFLPLMIYDFYDQKQLWWSVLLVSFLVFIPSSMNELVLFGFTILAFILRLKTMHAAQLHIDLIAMRDQNKEFMLSLEEKNKRLIERQDYEVNLATLNERNRIAREIHDTVGHQLTRSILQIGALQLTTEEDLTRHQLHQIKGSLDESMNSIRSSIHQLYEDSIDLKLEVSKLIDQFSFCPIEFHYQIHSSLPKNTKNAFLAIVREALTNITKHSNASSCAIRFKEHPGFFQLRITDNGTVASSAPNDGIGLRSIQERVSQLSGFCEINMHTGFHIFITIPKEEIA